jgi:hypothetical protein
MALAHALKAVAACVAGAVALGAAAYGLLDLFGSWYGPRYIRSDEDIGNVFMVMLAVQIAAIVGGAIAGYLVYKRRLAGDC